MFRQADPSPCEGAIIRIFNAIALSEGHCVVPDVNRKRLDINREASPPCAAGGVYPLIQRTALKEE